MRKEIIAIVAALIISTVCHAASPPVASDKVRLAQNDAHTRKRANELKAKVGRTGTWYIYLVDAGKILAVIKSHNMPIKKSRSKNDSPWVIIEQSARIIEWDGKIIVVNSSKLIKP